MANRRRRAKKSGGVNLKQFVMAAALALGTAVSSAAPPFGMEHKNVCQIPKKDVVQQTVAIEPTVSTLM